MCAEKKKKYGDEGAEKLDHLSEKSLLPLHIPHHVWAGNPGWDADPERSRLGSLREPPTFSAISASSPQSWF